MSMKLDPDTFLLLSQNQRSGTCILTGCDEKAHPGHDFCTKTHALNFLSDYLRDLKHHNRLCKMPGCIRHVFVENQRGDLVTATRVHEFCGWKHAMQYLAYKEIPAQELSLEFMIGALKRWALERKETGGVEVDENFFSKHPWESLTQPDSCSKHVIAKCKFKRNSDTDRDMTTIDGMHWKQQGRKSEANENITVDDCKVSKRYLTYSRLRSSKQYNESHGEPVTNSRKRRLPMTEVMGRDNLAYTIIEYKIVDDPLDRIFRHWCLLKVSTPQAGQRQAKSARFGDKSQESGLIEELPSEVGQACSSVSAPPPADEQGGTEFIWPPDDDDDEDGVQLDNQDLLRLWPEFEVYNHRFDRLDNPSTFHDVCGDQ